MWENSFYRAALMMQLEQAMKDSFLRDIKGGPAHRGAIALPMLPEYSKEPLDAEIVIEDVLDADLIG